MNVLVDQKILFITSLIEEINLRHQQRFDAQTKALDAAFNSAQMAVQAALAASDKGTQAAMDAAEKAVIKAEIANEKRFDTLIELQKAFNRTLSEQMPRREAETRIEALAHKVDDLKDYSSTAEGRSGGLQRGWGFFVGGIGIISTIVAIVVGIILAIMK